MSANKSKVLCQVQRVKFSFIDLVIKHDMHFSPPSCLGVQQLPEVRPATGQSQLGLHNGCRAAGAKINDWG
jgi:hypothetical protein